MEVNRIIHGDCLQVLRTFPSNMVDSVVTDPPYGLSREPDIREVLEKWLAGEDYTHRGDGFMGKTWDSFVPGPAIWREVCRVLKPGGHILCFAGTRTVDLMGVSLRLGGFEIRDCLQWLYGSGFPKSMDVSKAIDKKLGAERKTVGLKPYTNDGSIRGNSYNKGGYERVQLPITAPATPEAKQWGGWGTALKPANEPIILARKPLSEATVAENVMKWGTGGLNIDGCRIAFSSNESAKDLARSSQGFTAQSEIYHNDKDRYKISTNSGHPQGRFPANIILDEEAGRMLDEQQDDASRFFYVAKASRSERTMGGKVKNNHPTVKPIKLMRYLCRLITPPGGIVLDPFAGSGSTCVAARREGFFFIGIEQELEYVKIARKRVGEINAVPN